MASVTSIPRSHPEWDELYALAEAQSGYFTTAQAADVGYSPQLLHKYLQSGRIARVRRGIYRLVHFPATEHEHLVVLWLWSEQTGVFSHETALALHDLSDALPSKIHITLPSSWRGRRLRVPPGLLLHFADLDDSDVTSFAAVPVTTPRRTLDDCLGAHVAPDLVRQALLQARARGLISSQEARCFEALLDRRATSVQQ